MKDIEQVAIHESGHTVVAELLRMHYKHVTIEPNGSSLGQLLTTDLGKYASAPQAWGNMLCVSAGLIAEEIDLWSEDSFEELQDDWQCGNDEDTARLWKSLREHSEDRDLQWEWLCNVHRQTEKILKNRAVWRAVQTLSEELLEKKTIELREASEIICKALGKSQWNRASFWMNCRHANPPRTWFDARAAKAATQ